jgi:ankyrin repeat protein
VKKKILLLIFLVSSLCFSQKEKWDKNKEDWTPLMLAIYEGKNEEVSRLILQNVDVTYRKKHHWPLNALHIAIMSENIFAVKKLIKTDKFKEITFYLEMACDVNNIEIVEFFIELGANVNEISENGHTILLSSCTSGSVEIVRCLLKNGAKINHQRKVDGITALMLAAFNGNVEKVDILLEFGADKYLKDLNGDIAADYVDQIYPRKKISDWTKIQLKERLY